MYRISYYVDGIACEGHTESWAKVSEAIESLHKITDKVWVSKAGQVDICLFEKGGPALGRVVSGDNDNAYADLM